MDNTEEVTTTEKKGGANWAIIAVVVLVIIGVVFWFKTQKGSVAQTAPTTVTKQTVQPTAEAMKAVSPAATNEAMMQANQMTVEGGNYYFKPNELKVKKGEKVTLTFKNAGGFHNFVIDELNVKTKTIKDGQTDTVTFTADKAGSYQFYCSVGNHKQMGMKGAIIVE